MNAAWISFVVLVVNTFAWTGIASSAIGHSSLRFFGALGMTFLSVVASIALLLSLSSVQA